VLTVPFDFINSPLPTDADTLESDSTLGILSDAYLICYFGFASVRFGVSFTIFPHDLQIITGFYFTV
jgi:hypothetical protein